MSLAAKMDINLGEMQLGEYLDQLAAAVPVPK